MILLSPEPPRHGPRARGPGSRIAALTAVTGPGEEGLGGRLHASSRWVKDEITGFEVSGGRLLLGLGLLLLILAWRSRTRRTRLPLALLGAAALVAGSALLLLR